MDVEVWYSPSDDKSLRFVKNMGEFLKPIINEVKFSPNFITWPCRWCEKEFIEENCLGNGKYCGTVHDTSAGIGGKWLIMESLR